MKCFDLAFYLYYRKKTENFIWKSHNEIEKVINDHDIASTQFSLNSRKFFPNLQTVKQPNMVMNGGVI